jgi:transcriptional regulator with XRE-family HTH domain
MLSSVLQAARMNADLTQAEAASRLGVSQPYLSQLENGTRPLTPAVLRRAIRVFRLSPVTLPVPDVVGERLTQDSLERALAALGYPRLAHRMGAPARNPALVLLHAIVHENLDPRLLEALPWVIRTYPNLPWQWLVPRAKVLDLQNRLGFLVALARTRAEARGDAEAAGALMPVEAQLDRSRLVREDTLGFEAMPEVERDYRRRHRSTLASHWNVLSTLTPEQLRDA